MKKKGLLTFKDPLWRENNSTKCKYDKKVQKLKRFHYFSNTLEVHGPIKQKFMDSFFMENEKILREIYKSILSVPVSL